MREFCKSLCNGCTSRCNKNSSIFRLSHFTRGEKIELANSMNYIVFILSGKLSIQTENQQTHSCCCGQMVLLALNKNYEIKAIDDCEAVIFNFIRSYQVCDVIGVDDVKDVINNSSYKYMFHPLNMNAQIIEFVKSTAEYDRNGVNCVHLHNAKQVELFIICRFFYSIKTLFEFFHPTIDKTLLFQSVVRANSVIAGSVEELAKLCNYNINTFKKIFTETFKQSPYQWILQQKATRIKNQLSDDRVPIKAIVAEFGFADQSHLNVFCKKYLGGTSAQIRDATKDVVINIM